jgi:bacterioferritin
VTIGESVPEQLRIQLEGERQALKVLADGIEVSLDEGDDASLEFFAGSLLDEEEHADWLETELSLIGQVGEANYLAQ